MPPKGTPGIYAGEDVRFFFKEMPDLIRNGHLCLAQPPLYRLTAGGRSFYARDDRHRDALLKSKELKGRKVEIGRFKGLGEMVPAQLRQTTMDPRTRTLLRVEMADGAAAGGRTAGLIDELMGKSPEARLRFIQERAPEAVSLNV
jgi:topoisomerase-4 subunit B